MRKVTFEGSLHFHVGDDIEILKGIREPDGIRACIVNNLTQGGGPQKSRIDGVFGTFRKEELSCLNSFDLNSEQETLTKGVEQDELTWATLQR